MKSFALFTVFLILAAHANINANAEVSSSASYSLKKASVNSSSAATSLTSYQLANVVGQGLAGKSTGPSQHVVSGYVPRVPWIDHDGDGMYSSWEVANSLDKYQASDAYSDTDSDGLIAIREFLASVDPNDEDTDGDGVLDGSDFFPMDNSQWKMTADGLFKGAYFGNELSR